MIRVRLAPSIDHEAIVERALTQWQRAMDSARGVSIELYVKVAARRRVDAGNGATRARSQDVLESGHAVRAIGHVDEHAGFAASSGLSDDAMHDSVRIALERDHPVQGLTPPSSVTSESRRTDLDSSQALPNVEVLEGILREAPSLRWLECGTTVEILVGPTGWMTIRRRNRTWGARVGVGRRLLALRGFPTQGELPPEWVLPTPRPRRSAEVSPSSFLLAPPAAAPIVEALAAKYFVDPVDTAPVGGKGWSLDDMPSDPRGVSGGVFDDAGFSTQTTTLGRKGAPVGVLSGGGHLWRPSFRRPPILSFANLVVPTSHAEHEHLPGDVVVSHAAVVRLAPDDWVLDLEGEALGGQTNSHPRALRVRTSPTEIARSIEMGVGRQELTAGGTILPSLALTGLAS